MKEDHARQQPAGGTDWKAVHDRLDKVAAALRQGWMPDAQETRDILRQRARELAVELPAQGAADRIEIIEFLLATEHYGIETAFIREVCALKDLTPVPCTPAHVLGIINIRGRILSVIDLKKFFDLPERGLGDLNRVLVLESGDMAFGILADRIRGIRRLPAGSLQRDMPTLGDIRTAFLNGIAEDRTIVLDGAKVLSSNRMVINEEVGI
jgi:purine-binding chemotaxis protein CheW